MCVGSRSPTGTSIYNATLNAPKAQNIVEEWTERWRQKTEDQANSCVIVSSRPDRGTTPQDMHNDCSVGASRMPLHGLKKPIPIPPSFQTPPTQKVSKGKMPKSPGLHSWELWQLPPLKVSPRSLLLSSAFDHTWAKPQLVVDVPTSICYNL